MKAQCNVLRILAGPDGLEVVAGHETANRVRDCRARRATADRLPPVVVVLLQYVEHRALDDRQLVRLRGRVVVHGDRLLQVLRRRPLGVLCKGLLYSRLFIFRTWSS